MKSTNTKEQTRINYDRLSRYYDWLTMGAEKKIQQEGLARLQVQEGESVLEIGFGTGSALVFLARSVGSSGRVYGIDLSSGMLQVALAHLERQGLAQRVELTRGDAIQLPYHNSSMDAVFMSFTLEIFADEDIVLVLQECCRVLRTKGRICVVSITNSQPRWILSLYKYVHRKFPALVDCRPISPAKAIHEAGFSDLQRFERSIWGIPVEIIRAIKQ